MVFSSEEPPHTRHNLHPLHPDGSGVQMSDDEYMARLRARMEAQDSSDEDRDGELSSEEDGASAGWSAPGAAVSSRATPRALEQASSSDDEQGFDDDELNSDGASSSRSVRGRGGEAAWGTRGGVVAGSSDDDDEEEEEEEPLALADIPFEERARMRKCGFDDKETIVRRAQEAATKRRRARGKNAPREVSSKVPVGRHRELVLPEGLRQRVHRKETRDPRFSDLSGKLNEDLFNKSYSFLEGYREQDIKQLSGMLRNEKDERKRFIAQKQLTRLQQQQQTYRRDEERKAAKRKRREEESAAIEAGKTPFYLKKSDRKKLEVKEQFDRLKSEGKLSKFMAKKRQRNAAKERKKMPDARRS